MNWFRKTFVGVLTISGSLVAVNVNSFASGSVQLQAKKSTPLQKGLAFYRGKTVTYVAPTSAGSNFDIESRAIARAMGTYLHATINVEDVATGATVNGQNVIAGSTPNGLTIGYFNLQGDFANLISNEGGLNFNPEREAFVAGTGPDQYWLVSQTSSPYSSFTAVENQPSAAQPAKILVLSAAIAQTALFAKALGLHLQLVTGYINSSQLLSGFQRDDGPLTLEGSATVEQLVQSKTARVLATTGSSGLTASQKSLESGAPLFTALAKKYAKTPTEREAARDLPVAVEVPAYEIGAPSRTPSDDLLALDKAATFALHNGAVLAVQHRLGVGFGAYSGQKGKSLYAAALKMIPTVQSFIASF